MKKHLFVSAATYVLLNSLCTNALAQNLEDSNAEEPRELEEVIVTGSRIVRSDFTSSSPILTVDAQTLQDTGELALEDSLLDAPQFVIAQGQSSNQNGSAGGSNASVDLRGLGPSRNLVLLDGRRLPPGSVTNIVNLNVIPSAIIDRVEVISGGASTAYGSDAISGVVNLITTTPDGVTLNVDLGTSGEGDAERTAISLMWGGVSEDGRSTSMFAIDYFERQELIAGDRDFYLNANQSGLAPDGNMDWGINGPSQAAMDAVFGSYGFAPGTVSATRPVGVNADGTLFNTRDGVENFKGPIGDGYVINASGLRFITGNSLYAITPLERYTIFTKSAFEVSEHFEMYGQGLFTTTSSESRNNAPGINVQGNFSPIPVTNPFIPDDLRTLLDSRADPTAPFLYAKRTPEFWDQSVGGGRTTTGEFTSWQFVFGAGGSLGYKDWTWDMYGSKDEFSSSTSDRGIRLSRNSDLFEAPDGGDSICAGGYNPFGAVVSSQISPECVDYILIPTPDKATFGQDIIEGVVQGELFRMPAGGARFAFVATHRKNTADFEPNSLADSGDIAFGAGGTALVGKTSVSELGVELLLPLLSDVKLVQSLELNLGYRASDYDQTGVVDSYKGEVAWVLNDDVFIRGGYQRATRAPNIAELFANAAAVTARVGTAANGGGDPCDIEGIMRNGADAAEVRDLCLTEGIPSALVDTYTYVAQLINGTASGNTDLEAETADTLTAGVVFTPSSTNLSIAIDYYDIELQNAISNVDPLEIIRRCYNVDGISNPDYDPNNQFCALMTRSATSGEVDTLDASILNLGGIQTSGIDVQVDYPIEIGGAEFKFNTIATYVLNYDTATFPNEPFESRNGTIISDTLAIPEFRATTSFAWSKNNYRAALRWKYVSSLLDANPNLPGSDSYDVFDLVGNYRISDSISINGGINNVLDTEPNVIRGEDGRTLGQLYDIIGRFYYLSAKISF